MDRYQTSTIIWIDFIFHHYSTKNLANFGRIERRTGGRVEGRTDVQTGGRVDGWQLFYVGT